MIKESPKKIGRPEKFTKKEKYIYKASEIKLTVINKISSRNTSSQFSKQLEKAQ